MRKITLSDTQACVILYSITGTDNGRIALNFGRSTRATFRKLHSLGLIDCPSMGALLTPWGIHVWECLKSEPTRRTFSIGVIEPVESNADQSQTDSVQHSADKVNAKKGFPVATPQDTEIHFMGSGVLSYGWWEDMQPIYNAAVTNAPDDWSFTGIAGYAEDREEFPDKVTFNHATISKAIRKITRKGSELGVSQTTVSECMDWIFKGPDDCDFDAGMADEVMQIVAFGTVVYG